MRFYDDNKNAKWSHVKQSRTESAAVCVLDMDISFSSKWKNENVSFSKAPITFRGPGLAGTYDPCRKVAGHRWRKKSRQQNVNLGPMHRL